MSLNKNTLGSSLTAKPQRSPIVRKLMIVGSILGVTILLIVLLSLTRPQADKRPVPETVVKVDVTQVAPTSYPI